MNGLLASLEAGGERFQPALVGAAQEPRSGGRLGEVMDLGEEWSGLHLELSAELGRRGETTFDSRRVLLAQNGAGVSIGRVVGLVGVVGRRVPRGFVK